MVMNCNTAALAEKAWARSSRRLGSYDVARLFAPKKNGRPRRAIRDETARICKPGGPLTDYCLGYPSGKDSGSALALAKTAGLTVVCSSDL